MHEASSALQARLASQAREANQLCALQRRVIDDALLEVRAKLDAYLIEEEERQCTIGKLAQRIAQLRSQAAS